jgi:hypothetical protein
MAIATTYDRPFTRRVSWGALFAGMFVGVATWLMLVALGAGIGLAAFDPTGAEALKGLGLGVGIWGAIAAIIAYFFAGWLSSRLSSVVTRSDGTMHGVALWGLLLVFSIWLTAMTLAGATATTAGLASAAGQAMPPQQRQQVQREVQQRSQQAQREVQSGQAQDEAQQAAQTAKQATTGTAWGFFLYALLTLVAAALGGRAGVPHDRMTPIAREETTPVPPDRPLSPQRV